VEETALRRLEEFAAKEPLSFRVSKSNLVHDVLQRMRAEEERTVASFVDCIFSPTVRGRLEEAARRLS